MKINVGSKNPVKIEAVREAFNLFSDFFGNVEVEGFEVSSGVDNQPKSLDEIIKGAKNRAVNCFNNCSYGVGLEAGIFPVSNSLTGFMDVCVCVIYDGKKVVCIGSSPGFEYPRIITNRIVQYGKEVGEIFDELVGQKKIKQKQGAVGVLAHNKYTRKDFIREGIIMALFPILNKEL